MKQSSTELRQTLRLCAFALLLCNLSGCGDSGTVRNTSITFPQAANLSTESNHLSHDAGLVLAGEEMAHQFVFTNSTNERLTLSNTESAIRKSCGCTVVDVAEWELAPQQKTHIKVSINTNGRDGRVAESAVLNWAAEGQVCHPVRLTLSGEARPSLIVSPAGLVLSVEENPNENGAIGQFTFSSPLQVDWTTFRVNVTSKYLTTSVAESTESEKVVEVSAKDIPEHMGNINAEIVASVHVSADSPMLAGKEIGRRCRIDVLNPVELAWRPASLLVPVDTSQEVRNAKILLYGRKVSDGDVSVEDVISDQYEVSHTSALSADKAILINLELTPKSATPHPESSNVVIKLRNHRNAEIPLVTVIRQP